MYKKIRVQFHLYIQRMSGSNMKQLNSGTNSHVVLYAPRQSNDDFNSILISIFVFCFCFIFRKEVEQHKYTFIQQM